MQRQFLQTKLVVNQPGDAYEKEAERVADTVIGMPDAITTGERLRQACPGTVQRCTCGKSGGEMGQCEECQAGSMSIQRTASGDSPAEAAPPIVHEVMRNPGQPLDAATRSFMEPRFGMDFGGVRVHTDAKASESARAVNALAYTVGCEIAFGSRQYAPSTPSGQRLLAHELAHVIQQGGGAPKTVSIGSPAARSSETPGHIEGSHASTGQLQKRSNHDALQRSSCPKPPTHIGDTPVPEDLECEETNETVRGQLFFFCEDSDVLTDESEARLTNLVPALQQLPKLDIHGYASPEGPKGREQAYNLALSCYRARSVAAFLASKGVLNSRVQVFKHGGTIEFGKKERNRAVVIPKVVPVSPAPLQNRFRVAALSFLACVACNPFTDDSAVTTSPLDPPQHEPLSGSSFRMKHWIEAEVVSDDSIHIRSSRIVNTGREAGVSGYCGNSFPATVVSKTGPVGPTVGSDPIHGESVEWESELVTRVNADVPATLPDAPCGPLGNNPKIPPISNRFRMRLFADGTRESAFLSASTFPFQHLYEDGAVKKFSGIPVRPAIDFDAWATSTGVSTLEADIGFRALRTACCTGKGVPGCVCSCHAGNSKVPTGFGVPTGDLINACIFGAAPALKLKGCPSPCKPAGKECPIPTLPSNP